ncbi:MAG: NAD(P)/FAD-dependent oxidoreductase [Leptolyngbyaceae cyanobacterium SM1_4_3]|nr:NAD(P)/FAD-dependent oxidoreductase [Leptolyngbyaceae cyanobacterium SM1_4_3]
MINQNKEIYECVIVGGGSAGLSAALLLGRSRRVLVCDKGNPRNAPAHESHSFFTRDGISPHELLSIGRDQLKPYKTLNFTRSESRKLTHPTINLKLCLRMTR